MRLDHRATPIQRHRIEASKDTLLNLTPQEVDNYIDENVNSIAEVRILLKRLLRLVIGVQDSRRV